MGMGIGMGTEPCFSVLGNNIIGLKVLTRLKLYCSCRTFSCFILLFLFREMYRSSLHFASHFKSARMQWKDLVESFRLTTLLLCCEWRTGESSGTQYCKTTNRVTADSDDETLGRVSDKDFYDRMTNLIA